MTELKEFCPVCDKEMVLTDMNKEMIFRDVEINVRDQAYVCPDCKTEVGTIEQTGKLQKAISDAYRKKEGLLTGEEIQENRKRLGLTQKALADKMTVGIASIKRWEGGIIQSKAMDKALRVAFWNNELKNNYTGNRKLSIPRVKLVISYLESLLKKSLLQEEKKDKMLYTTKYLWYSDFIAYREIGKSMTGATYAALPYGPQFNNYKELIEPIKKADVNKAEPLSSEEKNVLKRIIKAFPNSKKAYDASHKEISWKRKNPGEIIPYSDSSELTGL